MRIVSFGLRARSGNLPAGTARGSSFVEQLGDDSEDQESHGGHDDNSHPVCHIPRQDIFLHVGLLLGNLYS